MSVCLFYFLPHLLVRGFYNTTKALELLNLGVGCWPSVRFPPMFHSSRYSVLEFFIPLFSSTSLHISSSSSSLLLSQQHRKTSFAPTVCYGAYFLMSSVRQSIIMANSSGLRVDPWCSQTSTSKGFVVPAWCAFYNSFTLMVHIFWWYIVLHYSMYFSEISLFTMH